MTVLVDKFFFLRGNWLTQVHLEKWPLKQSVCIWHKFDDLFTSHDLQFGFKNDCCNAAIFSMHHVVNYCADRGSCVHLSALDASKAFDISQQAYT